MNIPNPISEPQIKYLYQLLDRIEKGRLFVPKFQQGFVWNDEQRLSLLRSIKLGIPIGSFLVWETTQYRLAAFDNIGGIAVPKTPESSPGVSRAAYLLDGCQRLLTLFATLQRPITESLDNNANIVDDVDWRVYYDLEAEDFILQLRQKPKSTWLPVNLLLDSLALLGFLRQLTDDELIQRAERLSRTVISYKITLVSIETNNLDYVTTAFQQINRSGTRMTDVEMVAALSWNQPFDFQAKITRVQEKLAEVGWETLDEKLILSACRANLELDLYEANADDTRQELQENSTIFDEVTANLIRVAKFLQACGIYTPQMLPYSYQSVLLAEAIRANPSFNETVAQLLKNWLWRTAYAEAFTGINTVKLEDMLEEILMLAGEQQNALLETENIAPFPSQFRFYSSRGKLLALRLAELKPQAINGKPLNAGKLLGLQGHFVIRQLISGYSSPENCFIVEPQAISQFRNYLLNPSDSWPNDFLVSHAISEAAARALKQSDYETFLAERRNTLIELEKAFIQPIGLDCDITTRIGYNKDWL
jgi:hypothetical protein